MNRTDKGRFDAEFELDVYDEIHEDYTEWVEATIDKETTYSKLSKDVKRYLSWCETNDVHPFEATEIDIRAYLKYLITEDIAETTITSLFSTVSKYYHYLLSDPETDVEIDSNPTSEIDLTRDFELSYTSDYIRSIRREGRQDIIAPDYKSLKPIFDNVPGVRPAVRTRNELICRLLWQTALRADELSRVKLNKIDFAKREIEVRSSKLDPEEHELYHRRVWWEPHLDLLMRRWVDSHRSQLNREASKRYLLIGENAGYDRPNNHYQLKPGTISKIVKDAAHEAGIQEPLVRRSDGSVQQWLYTAHRLRHARISHLCNKVDDLSIHFVRMLAGHESIDTTLDYVKTDWQEARRAYQQEVY